jgi:molecular chaperone HscC
VSSAIEWSLNEDILLGLSKKLLERIRLPIEKALRDSRVKLSELDEVVLVGGATRMPILRKLVVQMFGRFPATQLHPDEAIALGAAVQAGLTARDAALDEVVMTDVAPYSMGVDTSIRTGENEYAHGQFSPIIERNTVIPASKVQTYYPMHDRQSTVEFGIYQGEARLVKDNIFLGKITVAVPPGKASEVGIDVRFSYDVNGVLEVDIATSSTGERKQLVIQNDAGALTPEQVQESLRKLAALKIHPREQMENRTLVARAERLFSQSLGVARESVRHHMAVFEAVLDRQNPQEIRHAAARFKEYLDSLDVEIFH